MVDEAIFNLSDDLSGPIFQAFYHRRIYGVRTYDSMSPIRYLTYDEGGRGGGDGGILPFSPRQDFPDTVAWYPALKTDRNGEVQVTLTLPDNLTSWRVMVKAATASTKVGEAYINIETRQDIVIRPVLPAALTAGDQTELGALVYNYSESEQQIAVDLQLSDYLATNESNTQTFSLLPDEMRMLTWSVTAQEAGEAEVTITASVENAVGDAILLPISIRPLSIPDVYTQAGEFTGDMAATLVRPVNTLEQSSVEIRLSRSIAGTVLEGLAYLTGYPYGCVEQTMSKALPNAVVGRALNRLGVSDPALEAKLPGLISMGLQKLYGMQHGDGGWGWWYDDDTNDYQTAWVVFGLALTTDAGYEVSPSVIENGAEWLQRNLEDMDVKTRTYALYSLALAGYGDLSATQSLAVDAYQLDTFSQAALALSLHRLGDKEGALRLLDMLAQSSKQKETVNGTVIYWPQPDRDGEYNRKTMASAIRSTALALDAFVQIDPENDLIPGIVQYLMQNRKLEGWGSTNETTYAVLALTDHLLSLRTEDMEISYTIGLNGKEISAGSFPSEKPTFSLVVPAEELEVGINLLNISQGSENLMYYTLVSKMYLAQSEIPAAGDVKITRTYTPVDKQAGIQTGDLVRVKLEITIGKGASFLIIEDLLPGGLEALNENINSTTHDANIDFCDECYDPYFGFHWLEYGYNQKEVHPDRVTFFITEFKPGKVIITYMARATHAGVFVSMPTEVYAMYDGTVWGRSESSPLIIEK
jgi:hypothetical protein